MNRGRAESAAHPAIRKAGPIAKGGMRYTFPPYACLEVTHPRTGERMNWKAELPGDFQKILDELEEMC